ncbi:recombination regulator RecX [Clostridioides difficile]|uniref:recombination regulator RecX n=1 Tax=Clostridioides difficile TaxID=1496 RepID=UPI0021C56ED5|nr:recombination regulator RecX [Clostridioides difficile]UUV16265.1 recombination regulator RecX [Clostridioides difficile]
MGIITKIEQQKRNDDRVNIYVDDKFFIAIFKELVYTFNLKKGNEINEDELKPILDDEMYIKAKNKALNILSHTDQSEKKLKEKLSSEFDENIVERVIDFLKSYNLVNDSVLAKKIVNTNVNLNKCGKNRIKQNLYNKGINRSTIDEAVSELDKDTEFENAMYLAKKRYERVKKEDKKKIYQKISQHLSYKGFDYDIIKRVLNKLLNFDEYDI